MHGWSALRVSLNHFPRVASPPEGSHTLRPWCGPAGSRVAAGTVSGWGSLSSVSSFLFY